MTSAFMALEFTSAYITSFTARISTIASPASEVSQSVHMALCCVARSRLPPA